MRAILIALCSAILILQLTLDTSITGVSAAKTPENAEKSSPRPVPGKTTKTRTKNTTRKTVEPEPPVQEIDASENGDATDDQENDEPEPPKKPVKDTARGAVGRLSKTVRDEVGKRAADLADTTGDVAKLASKNIGNFQKLAREQAGNLNSVIDAKYDLLSGGLKALAGGITNAIQGAHAVGAQGTRTLGKGFKGGTEALRSAMKFGETVFVESPINMFGDGMRVMTRVGKAPAKFTRTVSDTALGLMSMIGLHSDEQDKKYVTPQRRYVEDVEEEEEEVAPPPPPPVKRSASRAAAAGRPTKRVASRN